MLEDQPLDDALSRTLAEIDALGLRTHMMELETEGFTTIRDALNDTQVERARSAIARRAEHTCGHTIDLDTATESDFAGMTYLPYLLYDDDVFPEITLAPKPLALITWLLGESCVLSSIGSHFKGPGESGELPLHSDNGNGIPAPFPAYSLVANINYALTPYTREAGALAVVPRSHKLARQPTGAEHRLCGPSANRHARAMSLDPGDAVIWHGNTWHGSYPRELPGVRVNLAVYFARQFVVTQERHKDAVPDGFLQRYRDQPRLHTLLAGKQPYGWQQDGPDYTQMARSPRGLYD